MAYSPRDLNKRAYLEDLAPAGSEGPDDLLVCGAAYVDGMRGSGLPYCLVTHATHKDVYGVPRWAFLLWDAMRRDHGGASRGFDFSAIARKLESDAALRGALVALWAVASDRGVIMFAKLHGHYHEEIVLERPRMKAKR